MRPDEEEFPLYSGDVIFGAAGDEGGRAVAAAVERERFCISFSSVPRSLFVDWLLVLLGRCSNPGRDSSIVPATALKINAVAAAAAYSSFVR